MCFLTMAVKKKRSKKRSVRNKRGRVLKSNLKGKGDILKKVIDDTKSVSKINEKLAHEIVHNRKVITKLSDDISKLKGMFVIPDSAEPHKEQEKPKQTVMEAEEIDYLKKANTDLHLKIEKLNQELLVKEDENRKTDLKTAFIPQPRQEISQEKKEVQSPLEVNQRIRELETESEKKQQIISQIRQELLNQRQNNEELKNHLIALNKDHLGDLKYSDKLKKITQHYDGQLVQKSNQIDILSNELVELNELFKVQSRNHSHLKKQIQNYKTQLKQVEQVNDSLDEKNRLLKKFEDEVNILHIGLKESEKNSVDFSNAIDTLKVNLTKSKDLLETKDELIKEKEEKIHLLNEQVKTKNKSLRMKSQELESINKSIDDIRQSADERYSSKIEPYKRIIVDRDATIEGLKKQVIDLNDSFDDRSNKIIKEQHGKIAKLQIDVDDSASVIKKLEETLHHREKVMALLREDVESMMQYKKGVSTLENQLKRASKSVDTKEGLIEEKDNKIKLLNEQLTSKNKLLTLTNRHLNEYKKNFKKLELKLKEKYELRSKEFEMLAVAKQKFADTLKTEIDEINRAHEAETGKLSDTINKELRKLKDIIHNQNAIILEKQETISNLNENVKRKEDLLKSININLEKKDHLLDLNEQNRIKMLTAISTKDKQLDLNKQRLLSHSKKVQSLNANIITLKEDQKAVETINKQLMKKLDTHDDSVGILKEEIKKKEDDMDELESYYPLLIEVEKSDLKEKLEGSIKEQTERELRHNMEVERLTEVIRKQKDMLNEVKSKHTWFLNQFRSQFSHVIQDVSDEELILDDKIMDTLESEKDDIKADSVKEFEAILHTKEKGANPVTLNEIMPMIDIALQHGDSIKQIKESLISANYDEKDIDKALKKIKKGEL